MFGRLFYIKNMFNVIPNIKQLKLEGNYFNEKGWFVI